MARLSVHGAELVRVEKATDTPKSDLTTWERMTRAFCRIQAFISGRAAAWRLESASLARVWLQR